MITNATLQRIDTPGTATAAGDSILSQGPAIIHRCAICTPKMSQLFLMGNVVKDATGVLYILKNELGKDGPIAPRCVLTVLADNETVPVTLMVLAVKDRVHAGQDHFEVWLKGQ